MRLLSVMTVNVEGRWHRQYVVSPGAATSPRLWIHSAHDSSQWVYTLYIYTSYTDPCCDHETASVRRLCSVLWSVSNTFITREKPGKGIRGADSRPANICVELRPKTSETINSPEPSAWGRPVWARELCRISPPRFLVKCRKRRLNQGRSVLLCFVLFAFCWVVFSLCIVCIWNLSSVLYFPVWTNVNGTV